MDIGPQRKFLGRFALGSDASLCEMQAGVAYEYSMGCVLLCDFQIDKSIIFLKIQLLGGTLYRIWLPAIVFVCVVRKTVLGSEEKYGLDIVFPRLFQEQGNGGAWNGVGAALSSDGVHFADLGQVIQKDPKAVWN